MRYGYYLPTRGPLSEPGAISELVGQGEGMGFATIVIADHLVAPTKVNGGKSIRTERAAGPSPMIRSN